MIALAALRGQPLFRVAAAAAIAFVGAVALGWRAGYVAPGETASIEPAPWILPQPHSEDTEQDASILTTRRPWGGGAAFRDPEQGPAPTSWRLAGIVERDGRRFALITVGQRPTATLEYRTVGDRLPDGSVLVQIDPDSAISEGPQNSGVERRVQRLFEKRQ
jgi:hypothetical protein